MKRVYLFIFIITLIAAACFAFTIWKLPPQNEKEELIIRNIILFGSSLTVFMTCFIGSILHFFHRLLIPGGDLRDTYRQSLREGFFIALIIDGVLLFQKLTVLTIINVVLLVLIFVTLEAYLLIKKNMGKAEKEKTQNKIATEKFQKK
ncbi:hypothetical protein A2X44_05500 [candidate division CPR3 bacterium GWF2_35_18]|uniref:Uncharacterized protein n=1 Tax=candidate division CPR3 bacterium GW2011_GWF2_35_18 TaxID=1618350 RepID=A0A0G0BYG1_UNCC3|nr:MAG: hypothetical protein UR67_C0010G0005 [candidate division CPR3 bacterium GW2011_GWF2_35_18]OGB63206.1 MAG: hypothetical protein A2X44_05500 [candidate division CPR3 bacterium GWF2_35_18]OGB64120.1 MAG: hypothetical protein A2250_03660 [candidate division CPR3 bacterium RIFOXYA2_FULL_35_13]OGB79307.1 MAG: hypothetical protein A2296_02315 [candidate division CPR3 bacterium RIFOXYB2_FULL_35_8]